MNSTELKQKITNTWKDPSELDNVKGTIIALNTEGGKLSFDTYYISDKYFCKLWQWQYVNQLNDVLIPQQIQYWKSLKDCDFDTNKWRDKSILPKNGEEIIAWITESKQTSSNYLISGNRHGRMPLDCLATRIHIGYFHKGWFCNTLKPSISLFADIPWDDIFSWLSIDDFVELNEDPRIFNLNPAKYFDVDFAKNSPK